MTAPYDQYLTEARRIVAELAAISGQLKPADRRFVETWAGYLEKAGDRAQVGRWRLESLRRVAGEYGVIERKPG